MKTFLDCIPCFLRQALEAARMATDDESIHKQILRDVLILTTNMDLHQSPPAMARRIHQCIRELLENADLYRNLKQRHNQLALRLYDELESKIRNSANPLQTAVRLAIAGNIIDLGVKSSISDRDISKTIQKSLTEPFNHAMVEQLRIDADNARDILYLADNAGEIVFDRLLIEQLPTEKITVVVKGSPIINDATMEDARAAGLTEIVNVIDNGSDAPGTILEICSDEFLSRFRQADLIIAKGQGNYETLSNIEKNIYFILKAKCPVIASDLGCPVGQMVLIKKVTKQQHAAGQEIKL
ncbi:MAG: DUF89 family protein [Phycisphaerae bacterium]|nr:DUF89 family protein [Phycisphaerae bacterium]